MTETVKQPSVDLVSVPQDGGPRWYTYSPPWRHLLNEFFDGVTLENYATVEQAHSEVETYREYGDRTNYYTITFSSVDAVWSVRIWKIRDQETETAGD